MITFIEYLNNLDLIDMKLNVPQVRTKIFDYETLSDLEEDYLYDFIIDSFGFLKIGRGHYKLNKKQKYLYFAGRLKIKNNKIIYIDNDSGHHCPTKLELLKIINEIKDSKYIDDDIIYHYIDFTPI